MERTKKIKSEISHRQKVLNDTIDSRGLSSDKVLDLSTSLDSFIVLYYRSIYKKAKKD